jgi:hypothetical protein
MFKEYNLDLIYYRLNEQIYFCTYILKTIVKPTLQQFIKLTGKSYIFLIFWCFSSENLYYELTLNYFLILWLFYIKKALQ